ncbi:hypothetical protein Y032_0004g2078 [Ancylostoma ceylanicum]|nr:hypothetical protein Y032_0004g2078 [Ancylostoma ceylanicum]
MQIFRALGEVLFYSSQRDVHRSPALSKHPSPSWCALSVDRRLTTFARSSGTRRRQICMFSQFNILVDLNNDGSY